MIDQYVIGSVVPLTFEVRDADGNLAAPGGHALTIRKPDANSDTPTMTSTETGIFTLDYAPLQLGRYVAVATFTGANAGAVVDVFDVLATTLAIVAVTDVEDYLGSDVSWTPAQLQGALDAERSAQARVCRIDDYTPDLREALLRRVARNLAARSVPVAQITTFEGGATASRVPRKDPEVRRLEAPYLRMTVG